MTLTSKDKKWPFRSLLHLHKQMTFSEILHNLPRQLLTNVQNDEAGEEPVGTWCPLYF